MRKIDFPILEKLFRPVISESKSLDFYVVGGSVRDSLLGKESYDFDLIAIGISQEELVNHLKKHGHLVSVIGRTFGVIKFRLKDVDLTFDIALPRRESYLLGKRRKDANIDLRNVSIEEDLARRDFTMNAIAFSLKEHKIIDPFGGRRDIKNKIIRAVGNPKERFVEDPTRILRGIRFAVQLNFQIEGQTFAAMKSLAPKILSKFTNQKGEKVERVSWEVIGQEFLKALYSDALKTIELYDHLGLLSVILPEVEKLKGVEQPPQFHSEGDVFTHTLLTLKLLPKEAGLKLKLAALLHDIGKPDTFQSEKATGDRIRFNNHDIVGAERSVEVCRRFRWSNDLCDSVRWIVLKHMDLFFAFLKMKRDKKKALVRHPDFITLLELGRIDTMASFRPDGKPDMGVYPEVRRLATELIEEDHNRPRELVNGHEIVKVLQEMYPDFDSRLEGKKIGDLKKKINSLYDKGEISAKDDAFALVRKWERN